MKMTMSHFVQSGERPFAEDRSQTSSYEYDPVDEPPVERWPILVRILVIAGLSLALWTGIIWGLMQLF
jgi:hypothetical protein